MRYLQHIENMENIDSDIEFSDGSSDENYDFDSEDNIALAEISKWSVHLQFSKKLHWWKGKFLFYKLKISWIYVGYLPSNLGKFECMCMIFIYFTN